jgi:hypothetical protein
MPALPPAPNVLKVAFEYDLGGSLRGGTRQFWSYTGGPPTAGNLNSMASFFRDSFDSRLSGLMSSDFSLIAIVVTDLTSDTSAEGEWTGSVDGGRDGHAVTVDAAILLNSTISRRYRGGKPRIYFPFGIQSDLDSDDVSWSSDFVSACGAAWTLWKEDLTGNADYGCTLQAHVNVSYYSGFASVQNPVTLRWRNIPTPRSGDATVDVITSSTFRSEISVQRRRRTSTSA